MTIACEADRKALAAAERDAAVNIGVIHEHLQVIESGR